MTKVSYIMPYRQNGERRERNLTIIIQWLQLNFPDFEIILVESDTEPKAKEKAEQYGIKYIFEKSAAVFNRSRTRNIGALNATHDILVFADCDLLMRPEELNACILECQNRYQAVNPFFLCIDLSEEDIAMSGGKNWDKLYKNSDALMNDKELERFREDLNFAGGILIIRKRPFFYIGGWPEEIIGWGGEDDIISYKIERFLTKKSFPLCSYHLPHERSIYDWYDHPEFKNNCKKMNAIFELPDEVLVKDCTIRKNNLLKYDCSILNDDEKKSIQNFELPSPRSITTLNQARREEASIVAYPLILD